jgi:hypothetical protein
MLSLAVLVLAVIAVAGTAAVGAAGAAGAAGPAGGAPRADLRGYVCRTALDPDDRLFAVKAIMRPVTGTQKLQLKFTLLVKTPGSSGTASVRAGNLGTWLTPKNPTLGQLPGDVWNFSKSVVELDAPATYQFRVSYRWLGAGGRVLATAQRTTKRCLERELRPDLMVSSITVNSLPGQSGQDSDSYVAVIANGGATAAGPFQVEFDPNDNRSPQTRTIQRLNAKSQRVLTFTGPVCDPSDPPEVIADSAAQVDDLNLSNNTMYATCPAAGAT